MCDSCSAAEQSRVTLVSFRGYVTDLFSCRVTHCKNWLSTPVAYGNQPIRKQVRGVLMHRVAQKRSNGRVAGGRERHERSGSEILRRPHPCADFGICRLLLPL